MIQQVLPSVSPNAPLFVIQPANQITASGNTVTLTAFATNGASISYQWYHEYQSLLAATNANLTLMNVSDNDSGNYWVTASNSAGNTHSHVAAVYLFGNTNGVLSQDIATNYDPALGLIGNQGFGFGPWLMSTVGGGAYLSSGTPPLFAIWNGISNGQSTASRALNVPLPVGATFTLQLQMNTLDTAANQNGFALQDASGNTLFSYWHQGGDNANGHYSDANGPATAFGFAYDFGQLDNFNFTLGSSTNYTFTDVTTSKTLSGRLSGAAISVITFFRKNGAGTPSNGQDFKFNNLVVTMPSTGPNPQSFALNKAPEGWSFRFSVSPGLTYRLQRASNLAGPWIDIGTLTGPATGRAEFADTNLPGSQFFYRTASP